MQCELKLAGSRLAVHWSGESGEDAARRYVDAHRDAVVMAWREVRPLVTTLGRARIEG